MLQSGQTIGKWKVERKLRQSNTGVSYLCCAPGGTLRAIVKVYAHKDLQRGTERFERFTRMLARLNHPGIPRYIGTIADPPAIASAYREGKLLSERIERGPMDPRVVLGLARELAATLAYVHGEDIIHRAVKPETVFLPDDGQAQLVDFGVALESEEERLTESGSLVGTLRILPPETLEGSQEGPGYDLYGLGLVLYEALTGTRAFHGEDGSVLSPGKLLQLKLSTAFLDPGEDIPAPLRDLVRDLTLRDPDERLSDSMDVVKRLRGVRLDARKPGQSGLDLLASLHAARTKKPVGPTAEEEPSEPVLDQDPTIDPGGPEPEPPVPYDQETTVKVAAIPAPPPEEVAVINSPAAPRGMSPPPGTSSGTGVDRTLVIALVVGTALGVTFAGLMMWINN